MSNIAPAELRPNVGQGLPNLGQTLADVDHGSGKCLPTSVDVGQTLVDRLAKLGQDLTSFGQVRPSFANWVNPGNKLANLTFATCWSELASIGQHVAQLGQFL